MKSISTPISAQDANQPYDVVVVGSGAMVAVSRRRVWHG